MTHLHVFPYSDRPGTAASSLAGKVDARLAAERCADLRQVSERQRKAFAASQVGAVRHAITIEDGARAVTDNYLKVAIAPGRRRNERIGLRVLSADPLRGEVVP